MLRLFVTLLFSLAATSAHARCEGVDLRASMPPVDRDEIEQRFDLIPNATGNHWIARRDKRTVHIIGTLHINDPRMTAKAKALAPIVSTADLLLLEVSPEDKSDFERTLSMAPELTLITEGPSLIDRMQPEDWEALAEVLSRNGIPPWMGAKMRPWFLSISMAFPPCLRQSENMQFGMDMRLAEIAEANKVTMQSLEDAMTIIHIMNDDPLEEQIKYLPAMTAMMGSNEDDMFTTIASYFDEQAIYSLLLSEQVHLYGETPPDPEFEDAWHKSMRLLLDQRNRNWIPVIEAAEGDNIVVAVGALHLPGEVGVLNLLQQQGYTLERAPF